MVRDGRNSVVNRVNRVLILYYTTFNVRDRQAVNFWKHKGQIRDIPRQNFRKNKGHGLGEKKQRPI